MRRYALTVFVCIAVIMLFSDFGNADDLEDQQGLSIGSFEPDQSWQIQGYGGSFDTTLYVEGARGVELYAGNSETSRAIRYGPFDLGAAAGFTIAVYWNDAKGSGQKPSNVHIRFETEPDGYYYRNIQDDLVSDSWAFLQYKKSDFAVKGSPDWSNITQIRIRLYHTGSPVYVTFDDLQIVKASTIWLPVIFR